jgi:8-oxo-dGTP pyrophosphatase MutT (NUDIX family)
LTLGKLPREAGCRSILGGKVDFLETLEQRAIREAREEVGVRISLRVLLCVTLRRTWDNSCLAKLRTGSRVKPRGPLVQPQRVAFESRHERPQRDRRMDAPTLQPFWARVVAADWCFLGVAERPRPLML